MADASTLLQVHCKDDYSTRKQIGIHGWHHWRAPGTQKVLETNVLGSLKSAKLDTATKICFLPTPATIVPARPVTACTARFYTLVQNQPLAVWRCRPQRTKTKDIKLRTYIIQAWITQGSPSAPYRRSVYVAFSQAKRARLIGAFAARTGSSNPGVWILSSQHHFHKLGLWCCFHWPELIPTAVLALTMHGTTMQQLHSCPQPQNPSLKLWSLCFQRYCT